MACGPNKTARLKTLKEILRMGMKSYDKINWTYTDNLEEINSAMMNYVNPDERFEGLANPDQIINIQWLPDRHSYVVYWRCY